MKKLIASLNTLAFVDRIGISIFIVLFFVLGLAYTSIYDIWKLVLFDSLLTGIIWGILRLIDFVIGGPNRRRRHGSRFIPYR